MRLKIRTFSKINGCVKLPASKSISNRMLIINELANRSIDLQNISDCDDTFVMQRALNERSAVTDIMAAGTSMRFLTAFFATTPSDTVMTGTERMKHRPIHILVDALRALGAQIDYTGEEGFPPLHITGRKLKGGEVSLPGNVSSQYVSALLMVAPVLENGLILHLVGDVVSRPYINITLSLMRQFGITIEEPDENTFVVKSGKYLGGKYLVENDWSGASYWYELLALANEGEVVLEGLFSESLQGDSCIKGLFESLGVATTFEGTNAVLRKQKRTISHYECNLTKCPDLAQTMVATCCALGVTFRFCGLQSLKIKETDRLTALVTELHKLGFVICEQNGCELVWTGERCTPQDIPVIETYEDHRMAMCLAPCACLGEQMIVNNAQVVSKSYPTFWDDLKHVGLIVEDDVQL